MKIAVAQRYRGLTSLLAVIALGGCNVYEASLLVHQNSGGGGSGESGDGGVSGSLASVMSALSGGGAAVNGGSAGFGESIGHAGSSYAGGSSNGGGAGDQNTSGATTGVGGSSTGAAGSIGGTGQSISGAGGSISGAGGSINGAGDGGAAVGGGSQTATGCAKLSVPLDEKTDKAHFVITLTSAADLSAAIISMHLYVGAGGGGTIFNYVQDSGTYHFLGVPVAQRQNLSALSGWSTITWDVGAEPPGGTNIVKTNIKNIGIEVSAMPSTSWLNPSVIYVDSITVSSPNFAFTFDSSSTVYTTPSNLNISGQALWVNSGATDTTAAGTSVAWLATCP